MLEQEFEAERPTHSDVCVEIFNPGVDHVKVSEEKIVSQTQSVDLSILFPGTETDWLAPGSPNEWTVMRQKSGFKH